MEWLLFLPLVLVLIIFALLLSSVKISLEISDFVKFSIGCFGIVFYEFDSREEKTKTQAKKKTVKRDKGSDKKKSKGQGRGLKSLLKTYADSKDNKLEIVYDILDILHILCVRFISLMGHLRFKKVVIHLVVATDDASDTAISYGRFCALVHGITNYLHNAIHFSPKDINISADFSSCKMQFYLSGIVKLRLIYLLKFSISTAFSILKSKIGDIKNVTAKQH